MTLFKNNYFFVLKICFLSSDCNRIYLVNTDLILKISLVYIITSKYLIIFYTLFSTLVTLLSN